MSVPSSAAGGGSFPNYLARLGAAGLLAASMGGSANSVATLDGSALLPAAQAPAKAVYSTGGAQALIPSDIGAASSAELTAAINGMDWKANVDLASAAALPAFTHSAGVLTADANGALTVDGVSATVGMRIGVIKETAGNAPYNGIYDVTAAGDGSNPYVLTRSADANVSAEVTSGLTAEIVQGTANAGTRLLLTTSGTITLGTTALSFSTLAGISFSGSNPAALGSASPGVASTAARSDHVHPTTGLILQSGANAFSADQSMASHKLTNLTDGTSAQDAASLSQVRRMKLVDGGPKSANFTAAWGSTYQIDSSGGAIAVTMPACGGSEDVLELILEVAGNTVTITRAGSDTINGGTSVTMLVANEVAGIRDSKPTAAYRIY